jgi:hypothetical protein
MPLSLTPKEIETVLAWYEYANSDSFHFGGPDLEIPVEVMLVRRLRSCKGEFIAEAHHIDLITDWMEKVVGRRYGSAKFLFGIEKSLYEKIKSISKNTP